MSTMIEETVTRVTDGDHDTFAHYVRKDALERAIFDGEEATALCGKRWLPTKDAMRFPTCPTCKEIYEAIPEKRTP